MRIIASLNLCYLFFLVSSVFSSTHIDHPLSHETECRAHEVSASCHSNLPHEHEDSHPGEDSLLEHTFEDGASLNKSYVLLDAIFSELQESLPEPALKVLHPILEKKVPERYYSLHKYQSSRAPPLT